jgi:ArsR family transcriptional regulator, arsenate/arsenite/antimonite-responsive transcriptional repressor
MLVNIEFHRYHAGTMAKRSTDPDIQLLAALADPARMEILRELAGSSEVCACDLTTCCDVRQPTVSHHLKVLRDAGAVRSERRGNRVYYWISPDLNTRLAGIAQAIMPGGLIPLGALEKRSSSSANRAELPA